MAKQLVCDGYNVIALCLREESTKELHDYGHAQRNRVCPFPVGELRALRCDVTNASDLYSSFVLINQWTNSLYALVNNAGILQGGYFEVTPTVILRHTLNTSVITFAIATMHPQKQQRTNCVFKRTNKQSTKKNYFFGVWGRAYTENPVCQMRQQTGCRNYIAK